MRPSAAARSCSTIAAPSLSVGSVVGDSVPQNGQISACLPDSSSLARRTRDTGNF
jgi:hypothetical protein